MRSKVGNILMVLGTVLILAAVFLFLWNRYEARQAENAVSEILPRVIACIESDESGSEVWERTEAGIEDLIAVEIDGYAYIGYISVPAIGLELPVMSEWDYERLKIAPCYYAGSVKTNDLVIAAHNYTQHFGRLSDLSPGDMVYFTDMQGTTYGYKVAGIDVLAPTAVEEMTSGEFDMTLFTCTYGGKSRVTVRCERIDNVRRILEEQ